MTGEAEVVVAREGDELASVDDNARPLRRRDRAPGPLAPIGLPRREVGQQARDQGASAHRARQAAGASMTARPSRANSARSAATSGLPVVSSLSP